MDLTFVFFVVLNFFSEVLGFGRYLSEIPNGNRVMDPCTGRPWSGLGHIDPVGGGPRNAFGIAFATNGRVRYCFSFLSVHF